VGFILCGTAVFGNAQTTVNNTVYNTNIIIQNQRTVWANNPVPVIRNLPRPPAPVFQYQPRELLPYMSPRCAQLYEAELGGFTRRTSGSVGAGVHNEFLSSCPDAMSEARQSLNRDKLEKYNATQDQKSAARSSAQRDKITREQCDELLRILAGQRKRIDSMSDGEKADHAHSEQNYAARCKAAA
jgi:hypothetical protein